MTENSQDEELKNLLIENLADTKIMKAEIVKIKNYMRWRLAVSAIWILMIILPAVLALFYIPDIISGFSTSADMLRGFGL